MVAPHVNLAEIARNAGVGRAAVSNWRVRYADFPEPNGGTSCRPKFDRIAVQRWLDKHQADITSQTANGSAKPVGAPPQLAEPFLNLLRHADAHEPGVWLLHEEVIDTGLVTAPLIRMLAASGYLERGRIALTHGNRVLVRVPHAGETIDVDDIECQVNATLATVGHHITIYPARDTASNYTPTTITYRRWTFTGYLRSRYWKVAIAES